MRLKFAQIINKYNATHVYQQIYHQMYPSQMYHLSYASLTLVHHCHLVLLVPYTL